MRTFNDGKYQTAGSIDRFDDIVVKWIKKNFSKNTKVLDVGAGSGKYYDYLNTYFTEKFDALEIYNPNIIIHELEKKYNKVYNMNILDFKDWNDYDFYIFGDIIQHLSIQNAQFVLESVLKFNKKAIIKVPFLLKQQRHHGNIHQIHLQPDLTPNIIKQRYPYLKKIINDDIMGVYYI